MEQPVPFRWVEGVERVPNITCHRTVGGEAVWSIPQRIVYHSPTGMEWGYLGSGPADAALNVLALFVPVYWAARYHQRFKRDVISTIPQEGATLPAARVLAWLRWVHEGRMPPGEDGEEFRFWRSA